MPLLVTGGASHNLVGVSWVRAGCWELTISVAFSLCLAANLCVAILKTVSAWDVAKFVKRGFDFISTA